MKNKFELNEEKIELECKLNVFYEIIEKVK